MTLRKLFAALGLLLGLTAVATVTDAVPASAYSGCTTQYFTEGASSEVGQAKCTVLGANEGVRVQVRCSTVHGGGTIDPAGYRYGTAVGTANTWSGAVICGGSYPKVHDLDYDIEYASSSGCNYYAMTGNPAGAGAYCSAMSYRDVRIKLKCSAAGHTNIDPSYRLGPWQRATGTLPPYAGGHSEAFCDAAGGARPNQEDYVWEVVNDWTNPNF